MAARKTPCATFDLLAFYRSAQLQIVPIRISKVNGLGWHPFMEVWTIYDNAFLQENSHRVLYIGFINREGKRMRP